MSKIVYKLTDENGCTRNNTQWGPGVSHSGTGEGGLCGPGFIHYYDDPILAVLLNPIHANFLTPRLWEATTKGKKKHDKGLKSGCVTLTVVREIPLPKVTIEQRVKFALLCALEVCACPKFKKWAEKWISGEDRTAEAAKAASAKAWAAAKARAWAARASAKAWAAASEAAWAAKAASEAARFNFSLIKLAKQAMSN